MSIRMNNNKGYKLFLAAFLGTFAITIYTAIGRPFLDSTPYHKFRYELIKKYEENNPDSE